MVVAAVVCHPRQLSARGRFEEQYDGKSYQVMSVAADGQLLVWDIRFEERAVVTSAHSSIPAQDFAAAATPGLPAPAAAAPAPTVAAEVPWNPVYKVQLRGSGQGKCGVVKFAMNPSVGASAAGCVLFLPPPSLCSCMKTYIPLSAASIACVAPSCQAGSHATVAFPPPPLPPSCS